MTAHVASIVSVRAAIYTRVSTEDQEREGTSLGTQEDACRRYCEEKGYVVSEALIFRETYSGAEFHDRPRLGEMRAALREKRAGVVIAFAVDRLTRDQVHIWLFLDEVEQSGARLELVTEAFDDSPTGKFLMSARAFAAEVERLKIRERTSRGRLAIAQAGKLYAPGTDRYGYRRVKDEHRREVFEPEAVVVREIFEAYAVRQEPLRSIIRRLNKTVPSPGMGKRDLGRKTYWGSGVVRRMLTDPAYKGETYAFRWKGNRRGRGTYSTVRPREEWIPLPADITPAIVSTELWDAVQARLATNKGEATRNETRPYLLRGLIVCGCGRKMRTSPEKGDTRVYRCSSRETPSGPCGAPRIRADLIEAWVWDEVSAVIRDPSLIARQAERAKEKGEDEGLTSSLKSARRTLAKLEREQEKLVAGLGSSAGRVWELVTVRIETLEQDRQKVLSTITDLEQRIEAQQMAVHRWISVEAYCRRVAGRLQDFGFEERRLTLEALGILVTGFGPDWSMVGSLPTDDEAGTLNTTRAGCSQNARMPFFIVRQVAA